MIRAPFAAALLASVSLAACGSGDQKAETQTASSTRSAQTGAISPLSTQSIESAVWQAPAATPAAGVAPTVAAPGADPATAAAPTPPRPDIIRA